MSRGTGVFVGEVRRGEVDKEEVEEGRGNRRLKCGEVK